MISVICGVKRRYKWTYLQNRNRPTYMENKFMVTKEEAEESIISEVGIDICTVLCTSR